MNSLIVLCAGDNSLHTPRNCNWLHLSRKYDVAIIYYGDQATVKASYEKDSDYFYAQRGPKWTLIRDFLLNQKHVWQTYNFVAFPDDDLKVAPTQWNELFEYGQKYQLDLFQPSLVDNGPEYIKHTLLLTQPQNVLRYVNFVEIMIPIFSQRALHKAVKANVLTDIHIQSGWGVDYVLSKTILPHHKYTHSSSHSINRHTYQIAVIDAVPIVHTKPLSNTTQAKKSSFYKTFKIDPEKEMHYFLHAHHTKLFTPATLRCVPLPVEYVCKILHPSHRKLQRRSRPSIDALPTYLSENIREEIRAVKTTLHPSYVSSIDINKFYHKISFGFHASIRKNKLHIVQDFGSFESRNKNTVQIICDVLERFVVNDVDVLFSTDDFVRQPDIRGVPLLCMAKKRAQTYITYPDHTFYNWEEAGTQSWDKERAQIMRAYYKHPLPEAFFRGNLKTFYLREYLAKKSMQEWKQDRQRTHKHKQARRSSVHSLKHRVRLNVAGVQLGKSSRKRVSNIPVASFVPLREHAKWKYLLHIPGRSYAARLKYLLASNSVVMYVIKRDAHEYKEFWYKYLKHGHNCIFIRDNNVYDQNNRLMAKRNKKGKKVWDDTANRDVVRQIQQSGKVLEASPEKAKQLVLNNDEWRHTFSYDMILTYMSVVLNEIASLDRLKS